MDMAGKRSTPEQIIAKLRQVEVLTAQGKAVTLPWNGGHLV
jgi:hypothetical protein